MSAPLGFVNAHIVQIHGSHIHLYMYIADKNLFERGENRLFTREVELVSTPVPCQK